MILKHFYLLDAYDRIAISEFVLASAAKYLWNGSKNMNQSRTKRISLFVKGNADLRDPLFGVQFNNGAHWGGVGAAFRELGWPVTVRIRYETSIGFFALAHPLVQLPKDIGVNRHPSGALAHFWCNPQMWLVGLRFCAFQGHL